MRLAPALGFTTFPVQRWTRWRFHAPVCWRPQHESRFRVPRLAEDIALRRSFPLNLGPRGPWPPRGIPRALRPASSVASPCGGVGGSRSGPSSWCSMPFEAFFLASSRPGVLGVAVAAPHLAAARPPGFCPPALSLGPHRVIACCDPPDLDPWTPLARLRRRFPCLAPLSRFQAGDRAPLTPSGRRAIARPSASRELEEERVASGPCSAVESVAPTRRCRRSEAPCFLGLSIFRSLRLPRGNTREVLRPLRLGRTTRSRRWGRRQRSFRSVALPGDFSVGRRSAQIGRAHV